MSMNFNFHCTSLSCNHFQSLAQGYTNEDELDKELWAARESAVTSTPRMVLFDSNAKLEPSNRVSIQSPPQLPVAVTLAIREAACKVFSVSS